MDRPFQVSSALRVTLAPGGSIAFREITLARVRLGPLFPGRGRAGAGLRVERAVKTDENYRMGPPRWCKVGL